MRIGGHRPVDEPEINLIPLIDVILTLVIFFVVTATFEGRSALKLELPKASGEATNVHEPLTVLVNAQGKYFVGDREVIRDDAASLKATINEVGGNDRDRPVMLRADARTPYQAVITAQEALGQLGYRHILLAVATPTERKAATK
ncbi:biopolymer transporter ExbD [Lysobacter sp. TY2-98]|uniref:ExbD/TolR family protein n=1 Tax=Lysobacter sp. TY2-98 TaxID=2290922 RepID=UPI000E209C0D|nr:biopolymer transporter ExbD [Lysobacter sp. TY2-98]AXK71636.1 biopolymer transporter ExbD [Lysobacter sp. TY2-98]